MGDLLAVERDESALIWTARAQGLPVEHRNNCSPQAILQCRLVTTPRTGGSQGSSPMHAWDIVGSREPKCCVSRKSQPSAGGDQVHCV
jgi:hypothetical protein